MNERQPDPWQTNQAGAFLTIGEVQVWALGEQRFRIEAPAAVEEVAGFDEARERARELAGV